MQELDYEIGRRLQKARKAAGFRSARAFARHNGLPESTYSQHETGKRSLSPKMVVYYCQSFNISSDWLILGVTSVVPSNKDMINSKALQSALFETLRKLSIIQTNEQIQEAVCFCLASYKKMININEPVCVDVA